MLETRCGNTLNWVMKCVNKTRAETESRTKVTRLMNRGRDMNHWRKQNVLGEK